MILGPKNNSFLRSQYNDIMLKFPKFEVQHHVSHRNQYMEFQHPEKHQL